MRFLLAVTAIVLFIWVIEAWPAEPVRLTVLSEETGRCGEGKDGCFAVDGVVCYIWANAWSLKHEIAHCLGGRHGMWNWINGHWWCSSVTEVGASDWKLGAVMCRREDGEWVWFN